MVINATIQIPGLFYFKILISTFPIYVVVPCFLGLHMIQSEKLLNYSLSLQPYITELTQTAGKVETMLRMIDSNPDGMSMSSKNNSHKCSDKRLEKVY